MNKKSVNHRNFCENCDKSESFSIGGSLSLQTKRKIISGFSWTDAVTLKSDIDCLLNENVSEECFMEMVKKTFENGAARKHILETMPGEPQRINSDMCTSSALAVLIRRHQILHGELPDFTFADIRRNMTGSNSLINPLKYHTEKMVLDIDALKRDGFSDSDINLMQQNEQWVPHPVGPSYNTVWISSGGRQYKTKRLSGFTLESEDDLMNLLDSNPAGLFIYGAYNCSRKHAIVISDYEIDKNGHIMFYCFDSVEYGIAEDAALLGMRTKLTFSRLFTGNGSQFINMLANIDKVAVMDVSEQLMGR